jgi:hypothetical protein
MSLSSSVEEVAAELHIAASTPPSSSLAPSIGAWLHAGRPRANIIRLCAQVFHILDFF